MKSLLPTDLRILALLLRQGRPVAEALRRVAQRNPEAAAWRRCAEQVAAGSSLSQALQECGFPAALTASLKILQEGDLAAALLQLSELFDEQETQEHAWKAALWYPTLLVGGLVGNMLIFNWLVEQYLFVIQIGSSLTGLTLAVMTVHGILRSYGLLFLVLPFLLGRILKVPAYRIHVPVLGSLLRSSEAYGFIRWLDLSLSQGQTLPQAVRQAALAGTIPSITSQLEEVAAELDRGSDFSTALARLTLFPPQACWLLEQAERGEFRPGALSHAAMAMKGHNENRLRLTLAFVEPGLLIVLGLGLLVLFLALFSPLLRMLGTFGTL